PATTAAHLRLIPVSRRDLLAALATTSAQIARPNRRSTRETVPRLGAARFRCVGQHGRLVLARPRARGAILARRAAARAATDAGLGGVSRAGGLSPQSLHL